MPLAKVDLGSAITNYLNCDSTLCNERYVSSEAGLSRRSLLQIPPLIRYKAVFGSEVHMACGETLRCAGP